jgi:AcrR family transcriptional regulator
LIDRAARLFSEAGPAALTTRRLAAEAGTSTMAIYTHFGSMSELIREIAKRWNATRRQLLACKPNWKPMTCGEAGFNGCA